MDLSIIPECFIDTCLTESLAPPQSKTGFNHQKGCGTVTKVMRTRFAGRFALGIIDKDKVQVDYLKECREVVNTGSLILHQHKTEPHFIIQINPAMERFIIENAAAAGVSLADYKLPTDLDGLKKVSKMEQSKNDPRFRELFKTIQRAKTADFQRLASWIEKLRQNPYKVKDADFT